MKIFLVIRGEKYEANSVVGAYGTQAGATRHVLKSIEHERGISDGAINFVRGDTVSDGDLWIKRQKDSGVDLTKVWIDGCDYIRIMPMELEEG